MKSRVQVEIENLKRELRERERERERGSLSELLVYLLDIFAFSWYYHADCHYC